MNDHNYTRAIITIPDPTKQYMVGLYKRHTQSVWETNELLGFVFVCCFAANVPALNRTGLPTDIDACARMHDRVQPHSSICGVQCVNVRAPKHLWSTRLMLPLPPHALVVRWLSGPKTKDYKA